MMKSAILISSVMISAGLLTACGGGNQASPSSAPTSTAGPSSTPAVPSPSAPSSNVAAPAGSQIVISDFAYTVPTLVRPGQQVTVVNNDSANHTVTSDAGNLFDVRVSGGGGFATFIAPADPGTYPFHCKYHSGMHGSLTVQ
jgi:plastocyanin